jgi:hypothetical protein
VHPGPPNRRPVVASPAVTSLHEVALLRLAAQRIAGPGFATAAEAVRWMTAVQAQDHPGALVSVALRSSSRSRRDVEAALDAGEVVRSWPMRGTLHLVAAEDLRWMLALMAPRVVAGAATRRAQLDIDTTVIERARELAVGALAGGRRLSRDELLAVWDEAGVITAGQRGYHLLRHLAQEATLCLGPVHAGQQQVVLVDEWIPHPRRLEREEALGEVAWRYFASHGPATVKDLRRWGHLLAADARAGLELARPRLASLEVDGVEHHMDPRTPEVLDACRRQARGVFLLPGFDELILGYEDRRCVLATEHADRIVPGANGMFRPTVVSDGQVVGTWKHAGHGSRRRVEATPFTTFPAGVADAIPRVYAELP